MRLLNYEDFKNFTLSPAYSLICMTSLTKTIVHIYGPWAISVPLYDMYPMYWHWDFVFTSLASHTHTHTHTHTHRRVLILQPMTLIVILLCIAHPNLTYTITSPIVLQLVTHCMHCIVQLVTWNSIVHVTGCKTKTHPHTHTHTHTYTHTPTGLHRFLMLLASEPKTL